MMLYQEYPPHPALRNHVACMWTAHVQGLEAPHTHRVLPDNCIDILWQDQGAPAFAVGMMSMPIRVATAGAVRTLAVRFKPGAAGPFLQAQLPLHALTDQRAGLDQLWGRSAAERLADSLWTAALSDRQRIALVEHELLERLQLAGSAAPAAGALVARALAELESAGGALRIDTLSATLGVTRQHLAAQFRSRVGLTPKLYARICRFRRATASLLAAPVRTPDWAQLALDCGYFDQSHLIHDFQEFSGSTPDSFLAAP